MVHILKGAPFFNIAAVTVGVKMVSGFSER